MRNFSLIVVMMITGLALACGSGGGGSADVGKPIKGGPVGNNVTVTVSSSDGVLRKGKQDLTLKFADPTGKPVDVGAASLNFFMPAMGSMTAMNNPATLTTTSTPGVYSARVDIQMSGEWQAQVKYEGPAGNGSANLPITAQ